MSLKKRIFIVIERILACITDKIVCISEAEKNSAIIYKIANKSKLELITNGIVISKVRDAESIKKEDLGIPIDSYIVGMIGRLEFQKAPDVFVKAGKLIKKEIPNAVFIIVGNGDLTDEIKKYAYQNDLKLIITGWVDNPYSYLKLFDIALLLSRWEGFGLAIAEYMAAEKNVIATRVDAIPTLIHDGVDGLLVEVDNPEDVKEKVCYIFNHPIEAKYMRDHALAKVKTNYDIGRVVDQHIKMFEKLLS